MWDPQQYLAFADDRARPFIDLQARIAAQSPEYVVDLGCGPGGLTRQLAERWPQARVVGIDSSAEMIERAEQYTVPGRCTFELGDVRDWVPDRPVDVIVSNATLQWVPNHLSFLPQWFAALGPGGELAIQVPANFCSPSHTVMRTLAESPRWAQRLDGVLRHADAVADSSTYLDVLVRCGATVDAWQTTYLHVLQGSDPVLEWVRGTGLRPVLDVLDPSESAEFETTYRESLREAYPAQPYGTVFPFRRIFAVARRSVNAVETS